jgi:predicted kinase
VSPTLVIIRGNSCSGKTSAAREVRRRYGRGCALLEQDHLRRIILREHDIGGVAPAFIAGTARSALESGYHVVLEGILHAPRYAESLRTLIEGHPGPSHAYYFDIPFEETVRRYETRPGGPHGFTPDDMRSWYTPQDTLGVPGEQIVDAAATFEQTVTRILHETGLATAAPLSPCPTRCPLCAEKQLRGV